MNEPPAPAPVAHHELYDAPWVAGLLRPLLIAALATSATVGPLALLRMVSGWPLPYALPLTFAAALEGILSTGRLGRPQWRDRRGLLFRLGELAALALILRLTLWAFAGAPTLVQLGAWLRHPSQFFDGPFIALGFTLLAAWGLAVSVTSDFLDLALQPDEIAARERHDWGDSSSAWRVFRPRPRQEIADRLALRWVWAGVLVVFCAAAAQINVTTDPKALLHLGVGQLGLTPDILAGLLVYFLAGLWLMSQARLALLRGRWFNEGLHIAPHVLGRWQSTSLLAILAVAGLAALLPIGSTGWLADMLAAVIAFVMRVVFALVLLVTFLLTLLMSWLRVLTPGEEQPLPPAEQPAFALPTQAQMTSRLPDWLGGAVLWAVLGLIVAYFLLHYLRAQGLLEGRWDAWWQRLRFWGRARWARVAAATAVVAAALRVRRRVAPPQQRAPGARLDALTTRDQVRFFYLKTVRRAAERGLARPAHATPLEFAGDLQGQWPDAREDVQALTEAFVAARYDERPIQPAEAQTVQAIWRRVMQALYRRSKQS